MYSRRLSVELVLTVSTLQSCTDNIEYPLKKGNQGTIALLAFSLSAVSFLASLLASRCFLLLAIMI